MLYRWLTDLTVTIHLVAYERRRARRILGIAERQ